MNYTVEINKIRLHAHHGMMEQERHIGNLFEVSVRLSIPYRFAKEAFERDWLSGAIDYAEIAEIIKEVMAVPSCLLEHVTHRLRTKLLERFPMVTGGEIKVAKLTPPITAQMESATVTLAW